MGVFDNMKNKAEELLGEHSDKVDQHSDKIEQHSDKGLDMAADRADQATGGKYGDHIETGRSAVDERIGGSGGTDPMVTDPTGDNSVTDPMSDPSALDNPMMDDAQGMDPAFDEEVGDGRANPR